MGTINNGTQTIIWDYKQELVASQINKWFYTILKAGVYDGGALSIDSGNNILISPLHVIVETSTNLAIHINTADNATLTISELTPYVTCQFTWADSETNYMDFTAKAVGDILTTDVVLGMGVYVMGTLTSFDYTSKTWGFHNRAGDLHATDVFITGDFTCSGTVTIAGESTVLGLNDIGNPLSQTIAYGNDSYYTSSSYPITDIDGYKTILVDTTSGNITITLPLMANNRKRNIRITKVAGASNYVIISPHASNPNTLSTDTLSVIWLPKVGDTVEFIENQNTGCWVIVNERITSQLRLHTYAGYGSTDNKIMRFTNSVENVGNMFSENHASGYNSNAEGLKITINRSGRYGFSFSHFSTTDGNFLGLSLNSNQLTTDIQSITASDILGMVRHASTYGGQVSVQLFLKKGDIVRPHTRGAADVFTAILSATYLGQ